MIKKIIRIILTILTVSFIISIIFYIGNVIIYNTMSVPTEDHYLYATSFMQIMILCIVTCIFAYIIYGIVLFLIKSEVNIELKIFVSSLAFLLVFIFYCFNVGQSNYLQPYILKNILSFISGGIMLPVIEKYLKTRFSTLQKE